MATDHTRQQQQQQAQKYLTQAKPLRRRLSGVVVM